MCGEVPSIPRSEKIYINLFIIITDLLWFKIISDLFQHQALSFQGSAFIYNHKPNTCTCLTLAGVALWMASKICWGPEPPLATPLPQPLLT